MLHYSTHLHKKSKIWVTFVHGAEEVHQFGLSKSEFSKYFNVLLLDLRGHGKSKRNFQMFLERNTHLTL